MEDINEKRQAPDGVEPTSTNPYSIPITEYNTVISIPLDQYLKNDRFNLKTYVVDEAGSTSSIDSYFYPLNLTLVTDISLIPSSVPGGGVVILAEDVTWATSAPTSVKSPQPSRTVASSSSKTETSPAGRDTTTAPAPSSTRNPVPEPTAGSGSTGAPSPTGSAVPGKQGLVGGAIAGIVIAIILLFVAAAFALWLFCYRRRKRLYHEDDYGHIGEAPTSPSSTDPAIMKTLTEPFISPINQRGASNVKLSDLPLDDPAMKKVMDNLDHLVTDHITTYILKEDIDSYEYQEIFDSPAVIPALKNMFARDRLLVASRSTGAGAPTVNEMRAIFSYYIFTSLIDWRSLSERERQEYIAGNKTADQRQTFFRRTERSEGEIERRSSLVNDMLERDVMPFVPKSMVSDELRQAHLKEIATSVVVVSFKLGLQKDTFKFDFRNKDSPVASSSGDNRLAVRALGGTGVDEAHMEIVGETRPGAVVRAMLSPGVRRVPEGQEKENQVRKMKVITS